MRVLRRFFTLPSALTLAMALDLSALVLALITTSVFSFAGKAADRPPAIFTTGHSFYVAPNGRSENDGSNDKPWDLQTAFNHPASVKPGDIIWLRGGTYLGSFTSYLTGTPSAPILVRQYPGERATFDSVTIPDRARAPLYIRGADTWYWGFEVMDSTPQRISPDCSWLRPTAVEVFGPRTKFINLIIHDSEQGFGFWIPAVDAELYGNLIYHVGTECPPPDDRGHGHSIYVQNRTGTKRILDNILFNGFAFGVRMGGSSDAAAHNLYLEGNVAFKHGILSPGKPGTSNFILWGAAIANNLTLLNNFAYDVPGVGKEDRAADFGAACRNLVLKDNYFTAGTALVMNCRTVRELSGNTFYGRLSGIKPSDYPNNTYHTTRPTGLKIFVRPNRYEAGRAHITVLNWDRLSTVSVGLSNTGLKMGDRYEIKDAQNFFGPPVVAATYEGKPVSIPMTGLALARPIGNIPVLPTHTAPEFGVFVLLKISAANPPLPQDVATPTITPDGGIFSSPVSLTLSSTTAGATIRYTTDGSPPTATSPVYTAPFGLTHGATLQAKAFKSGMNESAVARASFAIPPPPLPPLSDTYLSELDWLAASSGWGPIEKDKSNGEQAAGDGRTITLNGTTYAKGLGVHACSEIRYYLGGNCSAFISDVGVDDEVGDFGSVIFQVFADGTKLYESGVMTGNTPTKNINVNVSGKKELRLVVTDAADGNAEDHADWAGARLVCGADPINDRAVPSSR